MRFYVSGCSQEAELLVNYMSTIRSVYFVVVEEVTGVCSSNGETVGRGIDIMVLFKVYGSLPTWHHALIKLNVKSYR